MHMREPWSNCNLTWQETSAAKTPCKNGTRINTSRLAPSPNASIKTNSEHCNKMKALSFFVAASLTRLGSAQPAKQQNSTIYNPILPGFNPDPSCVFVKEWDNTFFCATSTFLAFPGIPIHASKDLQNFRLIGHAFSRPEQLPAFGNVTGQQQGWYAPTLRYHNKRFWIINSCVGAATGYWSTSDPYNNDA